MNTLKLRVPFTILLAVFLLTSCKSSENEAVPKIELPELSDSGAADTETTVSTEAAGYDCPNVYEVNTGANISFQAEVIVPQEVRENGLYDVEIAVQTVDGEAALSVLFQDDTVTKTLEIETDDGPAFYYYGEDKSLNANPYTLFYMTSFFEYTNNTFHLVGSNANQDLYDTGTQFDFISSGDAYAYLCEIAAAFGLDINGSYHCYSLDYETMEGEEYAIEQKKGEEDTSVYKPSWTEEDNSYYFTIFQTEQGLRVHYPLSGVFYKLTEENATVQGLVSANGIEMFDISCVFTFTPTGEILTLLPFKDIVDVVTQKYGMILTDNTYTVESAELFWRVLKNSGGFSITPSWEIIIRELPSESEVYMYVDALTGEEQIW